MIGSLIRNLVSRRAAAPANAPDASAAENGFDTYFIGYPGHLFRTFAPGIFNAMGGRVAGVITDTYFADHSHLTLWGKKLPLVSMEAFLTQAGRRPLEVVHFFEQREQLWSLPGIEKSGKVKTIDFLGVLDALDLPHTYRPVAEERIWWAGQSAERITAVAAQFGDERSRRTFAARLAAIAEGDRRPLMEVAVLGEHEYFNSSDAHCSLVPGENEIYVDVGAAHGDTVEKFVAVSGGKFERIEAFEPTPGQFAELTRRAGGDPRIKVHQAAVGDVAGPIRFFDNPHNPFGGNALAVDDGAPTIEVPCVRLDDVIDRCTLLKMDVEGFECNVLRGARRLVATSRPDMAITCYHYPQDLFNILELVQEIHRYKHVALRHFGPSLYDSILLFSDRQSFN